MLPDLVENLRSLVAGEYAKTDRVICGRGNFSDSSSGLLSSALYE